MMRLSRLIPRSNGGRWAAGLSAAAVIGVGIYVVFFVFAVHLLFVDEVVDEDVPEFADEADIDELISEARGDEATATTAAAPPAADDPQRRSDLDSEIAELEAEIASVRDAAMAAATDEAMEVMYQQVDVLQAELAGLRSERASLMTPAEVERAAAEQEEITQHAMSVGEHMLETVGADMGSDSGDTPSDAAADVTDADAGATADADAPDDADAADAGTAAGATADAGAAAGGVRVSHVGTFGPRSHPAEGVAVVLTDGTQTFLRFDDDFATDNGPDLNVYLHTAAPDASVADLVDDFIDLGDLKGNIGAQNYVVPEGIDLDRYSTVSVWCVRFRVVFGTAALMPPS